VQSRRVRKQLATADGLIGYTLRAKPLARDYWTLSVWKDDTALRQFMRTRPHVQLMTSLKPFMGPTKFVTWTASAAEPEPPILRATVRARPRRLGRGADLPAGQERPPPVPAIEVDVRSRNPDVTVTLNINQAGSAPLPTGPQLVSDTIAIARDVLAVLANPGIT